MDSGLAIGKLSGDSRWEIKIDRQSERVIKKEREADRQRDRQEKGEKTSTQSPSRWTLGWPSERCLALQF